MRYRDGSKCRGSLGEPVAKPDRIFWGRLWLGARHSLGPGITRSCRTPDKSVLLVLLAGPPQVALNPLAFKSLCVLGFQQFVLFVRVLPGARATWRGVPLEPNAKEFPGSCGPPSGLQLAPSVLMCRPLGLALGSFRGGGATAPFHRRRHLRSLQFLVCGASDRTLRHGQRHQDAGASFTWCMLPAESITWARGAALWLGQVTASPRPVEVLLDHGPLLGLACP